MRRFPGNLSLFSRQGAEICSHGAFSFGEVLPGLETKLGIRKGSSEIDKALTQAENHDCDCDEWSERLVIRDPAAATTELCSQMGRLSMEFKL